MTSSASKVRRPSPAASTGRRGGEASRVVLPFLLRQTANETFGVDGPKAWDLDLAFDVTVSDLDRSFHVTLRNGVLVYVERQPETDAALHLTLEKGRLIRLAGGDLDSEGLNVAGDLSIVKQLFSVLSPGDPAFEIVLP